MTELNQSKTCQTRTLDDINRLIESKNLTSDNLNLFIECLPKSTNERVLRRMRLKPGETLHPTNHDPQKKAIHSLQKSGNNDPTKTARGKRAVALQGQKNKRNAHKFKEAIEYIKANSSKPVTECSIEGVQDKSSLHQLALKLLTVKECQIDFDWLYGLYKLTESTNDHKAHTR